MNTTWCKHIRYFDLVQDRLKYFEKLTTRTIPLTRNNVEIKHVTRGHAQGENLPAQEFWRGKSLILLCKLLSFSVGGQNHAKVFIWGQLTPVTPAVPCLVEIDSHYELAVPCICRGACALSKVGGHDFLGGHIYVYGCSSSVSILTFRFSSRKKTFTGSLYISVSSQCRIEHCCNHKVKVCLGKVYLGKMEVWGLASRIAFRHWKVPFCKMEDIYMDINEKMVFRKVA